MPKPFVPIVIEDETEIYAFLIKTEKATLFNLNQVIEDDVKLANQIMPRFGKSGKPVMLIIVHPNSTETGSKFYCRSMNEFLCTLLLNSEKEQDLPDCFRQMKEIFQNPEIQDIKTEHHYQAKYGLLYPEFRDKNAHEPSGIESWNGNLFAYALLNAVREMMIQYLEDVKSGMKQQ